MSYKIISKQSPVISTGPDKKVNSQVCLIKYDQRGL